MTIIKGGVKVKKFIIIDSNYSQDSDKGLTVRAMSIPGQGSIVLSTFEKDEIVISQSMVFVPNCFVESKRDEGFHLVGKDLHDKIRRDY